jgi:hypothetical protein
LRWASQAGYRARSAQGGQRAQEADRAQQNAFNRRGGGIVGGV